MIGVPPEIIDVSREAYILREVQWGDIGHGRQWQPRWPRPGRLPKVSSHATGYRARSRGEEVRGELGKGVTDRGWELQTAIRIPGGDHVGGRARARGRGDRGGEVIGPLGRLDGA